MTANWLISFANRVFSDTFHVTHGSNHVPRRGNMTPIVLPTSYLVISVERVVLKARYALLLFSNKPFLLTTSESICHIMFRTAISSARTSVSRPVFVNARPIHSTPVALKTVTEKVSEVADKVNKKVGKGLASAIETGEQATHTTKETLDSATESTKQKADEAANVAGQKTNQAAAGARKAKEDFEKEARK